MLQNSSIMVVRAPYARAEPGHQLREKLVVLVLVGRRNCRLLPVVVVVDQAQHLPELRLDVGVAIFSFLELTYLVCVDAQSAQSHRVIDVVVDVEVQAVWCQEAHQ